MPTPDTDGGKPATVTTDPIVVLQDVTKSYGRIQALRPPTESEPGMLVLPPLVDGHIHLDKTLLGLPWVPNRAEGNGVSASR